MTLEPEILPVEWEVHPSGDPTPIQIDRALLWELIQQGPDRAAKEAIRGVLSDDFIDLLCAHPLSPKHICPYCDAARLLIESLHDNPARLDGFGIQDTIVHKPDGQ